MSTSATAGHAGCHGLPTLPNDLLRSDRGSCPFRLPAWHERASSSLNPITDALALALGTGLVSLLANAAEYEDPRLSRTFWEPMTSHT